MRIALRTSGGRGEYEITGSQADTKALDLVDHRIILELLPGTRIFTQNIIKHTQGKPRIRLKERTTEDPVFTHAYAILASALLLPKPIRQISVTPGGKLQLVDNKFSVTSIQFEIINKSSFDVVIYPTNIIVSNSVDDQGRIDVVERMRILLNTWSHANDKEDALSALVVAHRAAFLSGDESKIFYAANNLRRYLASPEDPLQQIIRNFGVIDDYSYWMGLHINDAENFLFDEDLSSLKEAACSRLRQWRQQAVRGKDAISFSSNVRKAYNNTCLFSGAYLPKTAFTEISGVDSAHILPWAEYELNSVSNGVCLNKLCHWAFDSGIIRLNYDDSLEIYSLSIPQCFDKIEQEGKIDLSLFRPIIGQIPQQRLPENKLLWPNPRYIREFNRNIDAIFSL